MQKTVNLLLSYLGNSVEELTKNLDKNEASNLYRAYTFMIIQMNSIDYSQLVETKPKKRKYTKRAKNKEENKNYLFDKDDNIIREGENV